MRGIPGSVTISATGSGSAAGGATAREGHAIGTARVKDPGATLVTVNQIIARVVALTADPSLDAQDELSRLRRILAEPWGETGNDSLKCEKLRP